MSETAAIANLLRSAHTIAVVGLSDKRWRPSYGVSEYMQRAGYRIIPVNPALSEALGEKCYPDVEAVPEADRHREYFPALGVRAGDCGSGDPGGRESGVDAGRRGARGGCGAGAGGGVGGGDGPVSC